MHSFARTDHTRGSRVAATDMAGFDDADALPEALDLGPVLDALLSIRLDLT